MTTETKHLGETQGMADHDHDLVHELSRRLDALWRYDQFVANAEGKREIQTFWRRIREQETENVAKLKELIANEIKENCF